VSALVFLDRRADICSGLEAEEQFAAAKDQEAAEADGCAGSSLEVGGYGSWLEVMVLSVGSGCDAGMLRHWIQDRRDDM